MKSLTGKLTNEIINKGYDNVWDYELCIGAIFLMSVLERKGVIYSFLEWINDEGQVAINNKLYNVKAIRNGQPFYFMSEEPTFLNKFFPKKVTLKFVEIK